MQNVRIKAKNFFELLKLHNTTMWSIFAQMQDGKPKMLDFLNENDEIIFSYQLPETKEELDADQKIFAREYTEKLKNFT